MKIKNIPPVYLFISIVVIGCIYLLFPSYELIKYPLNLLGIIFIMGGGMLSGRSAKNLKKHNTPVNFERKSTVVVREGFFRYSRNPIYLGMMLLLIGLSILSGNVLSFITPVFCYVILNFKFIASEERKMESDLGKEYLEYKAAVRKWL